MRKIFLTIFFLKLLCLSCVNNLSNVEVRKKTYDFGELHYGDKLTYVFKIENISNAPYIISDVSASCGCTSTKYTTSAVLKGELAEVEVEYIPLLEDVVTRINKSIVVSDNSEKGFHVFYMTGRIEEKTLYD